MTTYMEVHYRYVVTRLKAPPPVHEFIKNMESFRPAELRTVMKVAISY